MSGNQEMKSDSEEDLPPERDESEELALEAEAQRRRRRQRAYKALLEAKGQLISTSEETVH
jgi:hypothetical protein